MAVIVGSARQGGSNGRISGDVAGDQNKKEVSTQNYYVHSKGWRVLRAKDASKRKLLADAMRAACANALQSVSQAVVTFAGLNPTFAARL